VLREALANAAKHAQARHVDVIVEADARTLLLVVTDDGVGLTESGRRSGVANMSARASELGGECTLQRVSAEGGTRLTWRVPISG
jgi:signal transduction histidine kinase